MNSLFQESTYESYSFKVSHVENEYMVCNKRYDYVIITVNNEISCNVLS